MVAPRVPKDIILKLNREINDLLRNPQFRDAVIARGCADGRQRSSPNSFGSEEIRGAGERVRNKGRVAPQRRGILSQSSRGPASGRAKVQRHGC
jgi:hypothetical protein